MRSLSNIKVQIIAFAVLCLIFAAAVLYGEGYYDFTFIDRPSNRASEVEPTPEETETETETGPLDFTPTP